MTRAMLQDSKKNVKSDSSSIQSPKTSAKYNKYEANKLTLCAITKDEEHKFDCIERRCQKCGVQQPRGHFGTIANSDKTVNWYQWECKQITEPKVKTRKVLVSKSTSFKDLIDGLIDDMKDFSLHIFLANWEYRQFSNLKEKVHENLIVCVIDFAENFKTKYQDECQSAHWCYDQVTIHPIVCYHNGKNCVEFLRNKCNLSPRKIVQFTDGCSSQYQSKIPFSDISCYGEDLEDIEVERPFFIRSWEGVCRRLL